MLAFALAPPVGALGDEDAARLDVVRDGEALTLRLSGPASGFFGDGGNGPGEAVDSVAALLREAGSLFRPSPAAACRIERVELRGRELAAANESGVYDPGAERAAFMQDDGGDRPETEQAPQADHVDADERSGLLAVYSYSCPRTEALTEIAVQLFVSFPAVGELHASVELDGERHEQALSAARPILSLRPTDD